MLRKPANCRRKTSTWCPGRCVSIAFHDPIPSSSRGPASLLCRSTSRAEAPSAVRRRSQCRSTSRVEAPRVPEHLACRSTSRAEAPSAVRRRSQCRSTSRAGAPSAVRRRSQCRSTFGCTSPVSCTTRSLVPEHVLLFVADEPVGMGSDAGQLRSVHSAPGRDHPRLYASLRL